MTEVYIGLFSGIVFGFIIQRVGATNPHRMARAHLMLDPDIPVFMLLAVIFAAWGLWGLTASGSGREVILPTSLVATSAAAALFGVGWGLSGYCPGTCWAAAGEGRMDAIMALLGGLCGTALFAHFHEWLVPNLYDPTNMGPITLEDWLGTRLAAILALTVAFGAGVILIGKVYKEKLRV